MRGKVEYLANNAPGLAPHPAPRYFMVYTLLGFFPESRS